MLAALLVLPSPARANGRFPRAQYLVVGPGRSDELFALRTTFGLVVSDDGGQHFRFLCEEAFQYQDGYDPSLAWTANGALLVGVADGLQRSPDLCDPQRLRDFEQQRVVDLAHGATGRVVAALLQSRDASPVTRFARSNDAGDTWDVATMRVADTTPLTLDVAPSDGRRMYATLIPSPYTGSGTLVYRSDDGGSTFARCTKGLPERRPPRLSGRHGWQEPDVEAKEAVVVAKSWLTDLLDAELSSEPRLEEVWKDGKGRWHVVLGFYRTPHMFCYHINIGHPVLDEGSFYPHHNLYFVTSDAWDLQVLGGLLVQGAQKRPEFLALNAFGKVPVIEDGDEVEGGDGLRRFARHGSSVPGSARGGEITTGSESGSDRDQALSDAPARMRSTSVA